MIKEFSKSHPIIFFPVKWANSVARWCLGVHSTSGTIKITNTPNPGSSGSCSLDVNIESVYNAMAERLAGEFVRKSDLPNEIAKKSDGSLSDRGDTIHVKVGNNDSSDDGESGDTPTPSIGSCKYGVRFGFANVMNNIVPTTIKWMAVGKESDLDTYTGETTWNGFTLGVFSCNTAENNYPVKVIPGDLITGMMSVKPECTYNQDGSVDEIFGLTFGKLRDLVLHNDEATNFTYLCRNGVRPTFNNSGVLTKLEFGSDDDLIGNVTAKIKTVETQIGCPYQQQ